MHALDLLIPHYINGFLGAFEIKLILSIFFTKFRSPSILKPREQALILRDISLRIPLSREYVLATLLLPNGALLALSSTLPLIILCHLVEQPERGVLLAPLSQASLKDSDLLLIFLLQLSLDRFVLHQLGFFLLLFRTAQVPVKAWQTQFLTMKFSF